MGHKAIKENTAQAARVFTILLESPTLAILVVPE